MSTRLEMLAVKQDVLEKPRVGSAFDSARVQLQAARAGVRAAEKQLKTQREWLADAEKAYELAFEAVKAERDQDAIAEVHEQ